VRMNLLHVQIKHLSIAQSQLVGDAFSSEGRQHSGNRIKVYWNVNGATPAEKDDM